MKRAFGRLNKAGTFATTVTRPQLFADYLCRAIATACRGIMKSKSRSPARPRKSPFPYVIDASSGLGTVSPVELAKHFPATELALIGDELADGMEATGPDDAILLALFDGLRTDFSLARLAHYTGTSTEHFQRFILFTNYHRYVDEFVDWAGKQLGKDGYTALPGAGG